MPKFRVMRDVQFVDVEAETEEIARQRSVNFFDNSIEYLIAWEIGDDDEEQSN